MEDRGSGIGDVGSGIGDWRIGDRGSGMGTASTNEIPNVEQYPQSGSNAILFKECFLIGCDYATLPSLVFVK